MKKIIINKIGIKLLILIPIDMIISFLFFAVLINMVKLENVSYIINKNNDGAKVEAVKNRKDLVKELNGPFSNFSDIFDLLGDENG